MSTVTASPATHKRGAGEKRDNVLWTLVVLASVVSAVAAWITYRVGNALTYNDAISHLEIARRVAISPNPGLAQLGTVWLLLPHLLMLPFVGIDSLYYSGFAGTIVSMAAFVVACAMIYKILRQLTGKKLPGVVGAVVFAVNVNVLYMQSTPMTEMLLFATLLTSVYYLQRWTDTYSYKHLVGAAVAALAATLTRYESWPILAVLLVVVFIAAAREPRHFLSGRERRGRVQDIVIVFSVAAFAGIAFWLVWNQAIFGNALSFQNGEYAKPSLWLTNNEPAMHNLALSAKVFWYATAGNIPWPLLVVAAVGLVMFIEIEMVAGRLKPRSLVIPALLVIVPFFIAAIYTGQRPLHVQQVNHDLYNTRFGLIMIIPVALFCGYVVGFFRKFKYANYVVGVVVAALAVATAVPLLNKGDIITWRDPQSALSSSRITDQLDVAAYLKPRHDGGVTLMETFGNERIAFMAIPSKSLVYEGTNKDARWKRSLVNPASTNIEWVVMRCTPDYRDKVCDSLQDGNVLTGYTLVYTHPSGHYKIYKRS